ncbi:teichuronic acid biosynthesis glycosyltransferase TuaG [Gracilibacillus orientalis]|uniref:Teichuronic acid biosynthesis glycosyltransferase TuaG n=1 Tax=Gracilibacillus orientalis TaxID=334253 RepID=A0A1I4PHS6_9BACI|nr:glycosyltransferase family 2 protein [Gracilibacillus orientalis]SFM27369.1 teichuronic acid biosynthesis glycosyltransferase TuaG [Gracilibacillus orientalis]
MNEIKDQHLVSVITPTYNSETYIRETIESVQMQTYRNWEMIIVDDGSTDQTISIIEEYQKEDDRIRLILLEKNQGAAVARNTAIENAQGKYIAFLDSDDRWLPEKLERQLAFMQEHDYAFTYTGYNRVQVNDEGKTLEKEVQMPENATYKQLLKSCVIGCLTVMLDREKITDIRMPNIRSRQDYALWLHLTRRGYTAYGLQEALAAYRVRSHSISSNKIRMAKQNWIVYREIEKLSLLKSVWYFVHYVFLKVKAYLNYMK